MTALIAMRATRFLFSVQEVGTDLLGVIDTVAVSASFLRRRRGVGQTLRLCLRLGEPVLPLFLLESAFAGR